MLLTGEDSGYYRDYGRTRAGTSRACWPRASPIRARPRRIAGSTARRTVRQPVAARFRQFPAEPRPDRQSAVRRSPDDARRRGCAHGGACRHAARADAAAPVHGRGMGIDPAVSVLLRFPGPLADAVRKGRREEFKAAYAELGDDDSRSARGGRRSARPCSIGDARATPAGRKRLALVRDLLAIRRQEIVPHLAERNVRQRRNVTSIGADARLVARRRRGAQPAGQSVGLQGADLPARLSIRRGRSGAAIRPATAAALVGVLEHRSGMMPPAIPLATYRLQFTPQLRLRRCGRARALSQGARHQPSLCVALPQGARGQHARLRHRRSQRAQSRARRRGRLSSACALRSIRRISGSFSISCPTTWAFITPTIPGGSTCWNGDRNLPMRASFDIDWQTLPAHPRGGVLIPILGSSYGEALERGEIELRYDAAEGSFSAWYYEHRLPIAPSRYGEILQQGRGARRARARSPPAASSWNWRRAIAARTIPPRDQAPAFKARARRHRRRQGRDRTRPRAPIGRNPASRRRSSPCTHLLERQHYRLAHWRLAGSEINYRRFFDINTLAGLRVEDRGTFDADACASSAASSPRAGCRDCASITSMACVIRISISAGCSG